MPESWVINASPIILLAKVGLIEKVVSLANSFVIPEPVAVEVSKDHNDAATYWLESAGKKLIQPAVPELPELSRFEIGPGERSVISWAKAHPGFTAILDDQEARIAARQLGVKVLGLISEIKPHLLQIKSVGGYISDELLREVLSSAGEEP